MQRSGTLIGFRSLLLCLWLLLAAGPVSGQIDEWGRIGLSAAPDSYVANIEVESGEEFTLYVICHGPEEGMPIPFDVGVLNWVVFAPCCGASYDITAIEYDDSLQHEGFPFSGVVSTAEDCLEDDFVLLATVTFIMQVPAAGDYLLGAGALGPSNDCEGGSHFLMDQPVIASVDGGFTPGASRSWGAVKSLFR